MKSLVALIILFFSPILLFAQDISGLWSGMLVNDSMKRKQSFEMGLSEYRGKITGYTYTTFIENDTFYYSIKRVKAERRDSVLVVEDVEMVSNNFPAKVSKGVKQITTFPLINDSTIDIARGSWKTTQTKKYYSIAGNAALTEQKDEKESDLIAHLDELKIKTDLAARKPEKRIANPVVTVLPTRSPVVQKKIEQPLKTNPAITNTAVAVTAPPQEKPKEVVQQNVTAETRTNPEGKKSVAVENNSTKLVQPENKPVQPLVEKQKPQSIAKTETPKQIPPQAIVKSNTTVTSPPVSTTNVVSKPITQPQPTQSNIQQPVQTPQTISIENKPNVAIKELPAVVATRKIASTQEVFFKGDSLVLALYDNGIVDGDTVSVFLNGESILPKLRLKESATKKTIYITADTPDSLELVLFAENLGTIPPNTGLLTIRDGDDLYQVRFSADLSTNAKIVLRRRR
jgi:hypothetical protein